MGIRPGGRRSDERSRPLWEFLIGSGKHESATDDPAYDRQRLNAFERAFLGTSDHTIPREVQAAAEYVSDLPLTTSGQRLLERWRTLNWSHRMILLKSCAEWVFSRYERGIENYNRQIKLWRTEKREWETKNSDLTMEACAHFDRVFSELGITSRNPRICSWDRLKGQKDDCEYAGEFLKGRNHSALCVNYSRFLEGLDKRHRKHFPGNAQLYLETRQQKAELSWEQAMEIALKGIPQARVWFPNAWKRYTRDVISEKAIREEHGGLLPHCQEFNNRCAWNVHTEQCGLYRSSLAALPEEIRQQEAAYRRWRGNGYAWPPRKPVFQYPSAGSLPMPKLFGRDFFEIDFTRSVVRLRLDVRGNTSSTDLRRGPASTSRSRMKHKSPVFTFPSRERRHVWDSTLKSHISHLAFRSLRMTSTLCGKCIFRGHRRTWISSTRPGQIS